MKYGATPKCRGCQAIGRAWKRPYAHSEECRSRIIEKIVENGDPDGRVAIATKKAISTDDAAYNEDQDEFGDVMEAELRLLIKESTKQARRGRGHLKSKDQIMRGRRTCALLGRNRFKDIHEVVWGQHYHAI